ncbi:Mitochondrial inner membrane protein oxa1l [Gonapodya sp. JEL0774]|nr:Mitochondrial inner membrane protein oxa1l [Gonapodya sp. JEL0774]
MAPIVSRAAALTYLSDSTSATAHQVSDAVATTGRYISDAANTTGSYLGSWTSWVYGGGKQTPPSPDVISQDVTSPDVVAEDITSPIPSSVDMTLAPPSTIPTTPLPETPLDIPSSTITPPADFSTLTSAADHLSTAASSIDPALLSTPLHIGSLRELGLGSFATPVGLLENLLEAVHVLSGAPWWLTIAATTLAIRALLIPVVGRMQRNAAVMANLQPVLKPLQQQLTEAARAGDRVTQMQKTDQLKKLYAEHNVNPFAMLGTAVVQMPIWISFYLALTAMAALPVPGFTDQGLLWFTNLAVPDPLGYALPMVSALGFLAVFELGAEMNKSTMQPGAKLFFRIMAISMIPMTAAFPAAIFVYWTTTNIFTVLQIPFFRVPAVRSHYRIPELKNAQAPLGARDTSSLLLGVDKVGLKDAWKIAKEAEQVIGEEAKVEAVEAAKTAVSPVSSPQKSGGSTSPSQPTSTSARQPLPTVTVETTKQPLPTVTYTPPPKPDVVPSTDSAKVGVGATKVKVPKTKQKQRK